MESTNPYAPPEVERTAFRSPHEVLFEHRHSSRNVFGAIITFLVGCLAISLLVQFAGELLRLRSMGTVLSSADYLVATCSALFWVALSAWLVFGLVSPRITQFRVDREFVYWRTPWPRITELRIPVTSISRVEYEGTQVSIATSERTYRPPLRAYGKQSEEVLEAIKAAVNESEPSTRVSEVHRTTSVSLMRMLGRGVGYVLRMFRLLR